MIRNEFSKYKMACDWYTVYDPRDDVRDEIEKLISCDLYDKVERYFELSRMPNNNAIMTEELSERVS